MSDYPPSINARDIRGFCPMGCGETLFVGSGGFITCSYIDCPQPDAVAIILEDRETGHVVELRMATFSIKHPLRERLGDQMLACDLHSHLSNAARPGRPPSLPGRYRVRPLNDGYHWEVLP